MISSRNKYPLWFAALLLFAVPTACTADDETDPAGFLREPVYDTTVHADEALVNVRLAVSTWPDCTTLESAVRDIFRIEGVADQPDQAKALALWKWFRILVSATGGSYAYEIRGERQVPCQDPQKIFSVYGHHQCDGLSWAMVGLWRAAGYMALDECTWGHTTAALRYRDTDGEVRYHSFDPQRRYYHWDNTHGRVSTRSLPVMRGMVYRHVTAPRYLHSLRTSLRVGETIERRWDNSGHIVPSGRDKRVAEQRRYYVYSPGKQSGIYAAVGEQIQTFQPPDDPAIFASAVYESSLNATCSKTPASGAILHPRRKGETAEIVYRLAPPYVIADAHCEVTLLKSHPQDVCRLLVSSDGGPWQLVFEKDAAGEKQVTIDLGKSAWKLGDPHVYTAYDVYVKAELKTAGEASGVGLKTPNFVVHRMLNKRTLPNLRPGVNVWKVTADRMAPGFALELRVDYSVRGKLIHETRFVRSFPYFFRIDVPGVPETIHDNYDQHFNDGLLKMSAIRMRLVPLDEVPSATPPSMDAAEAQVWFRKSYPHPAEMTNPKLAERSERDVRETSGFFPQSVVKLNDTDEMNRLIDKLRTGDTAEQWVAAEDLGNYPAALDTLLAELPTADIDLTLFITKALAQIGDRRAIGPLLEKWKRAPRGAPGTRYIPDALAAIGDPSVVPALVAPLKRCRFDYRFHITHALGVLGGAESEAALKDLAANDPFPAIREEAQRALATIARRKD